MLESKIKRTLVVVHRGSYVLAVAIVLIIWSSGTPTACGETFEDAEEKIAEGWASFYEAYDATLEAEKSGANVTGAVEKLNDALDQLSLSEYARDVGRYDVSVEYATKASEGCREIVGEVKALGEEASWRKTLNFIISFLYLSGGLILVLVVAFRAMRWWEKEKMKRMKIARGRRREEG